MSLLRTENKMGIEHEISGEIGGTMSKEIVIGEDIKPIFTSIALWYYGDVSENTVFYVFNSYITDTRIYIYKKSKEGEEIEEWLSLEENRNNDSVQRKALEILLPRLTVDEFLGIIDKEKSISWNNGYKKAQHDIRKALGL